MKEQVSSRITKAKEGIPDIPVEMNLGRLYDQSKAHEIVDTVKEFKESPTYRTIKRRGLQFVPTRVSKGSLIGVVGTAAAIGAGYMWYKHLKSRTTENENPSNSSAEKLTQDNPGDRILVENIPITFLQPEQENTPDIKNTPSKTDILKDPQL